MVICRFAVMKWMTVAFFRSFAIDESLQKAKSRATRRQISFLLLFNYVKNFFVIKILLFLSSVTAKFSPQWQTTFNKSPSQYISAIELSLRMEVSCHLSIDFHFDINDRKVESTDKHECERWSIKNNCVLFK